MEGFLQEINEWLASVNDVIDKRKNLNEHIILENKYFKYGISSNHYTTNVESINQIINAKYLFVGDNPGENERLNYSFFYYSNDPKWIKDNKSSAGTKFHKFVERAHLSDNQFVKFNKCLIFSKSTTDLTLSQIDATQKIVIAFLKILTKYNSKIKIVVMGLNGKFNSMYKQLIKEFPDIIITPHPCSSLYRYNNTVVINSTSNLDIEDFCRRWKNKNIMSNFMND